MIGNKKPFRGLRRTIITIFEQESLKAPSDFVQIGHFLKWDIFKLGSYLPFGKLKGFYVLLICAIFCSLAAMAIFFLSKSWETSNATEQFLKGITNWRQSYSDIFADSAFEIHFQDSEGIYDTNQTMPMVLRHSMDYFYDGYKVDYPESFLMFGDSNSLNADYSHSESSSVFMFSRKNPMLSNYSPSVGFSMSYSETWQDLSGLKDFRQIQNPIELWKREVIKMDKVCRGRSSIDCANLCENQLGLFKISDDLGRICVNYYVLAAVCLTFDFSSLPPKYVQGCFSNQEMTYYIQAIPEQPYGLNLSLWMARDIHDPYVLAYELSGIQRNPNAVYSASVFISFAESLLLSSILLFVTLTFGYFLLLTVNEGLTIKQNVWKSGLEFKELSCKNQFVFKISPKEHNLS